MDCTVYQNDVISQLKEFKKNNVQFHFALYDPPYDLKIVGKEWDNFDILASEEYNQLLYDVMLPGGFVLCYSHARVHHRVLVALENAGFIVHKTIFGWTYASGNPQGAANIQRNMEKYFAKQYNGICECDNPVKGQTIRGHIDPKFASTSIPVDMCQTCGKPIRVVLEEIQWGESTGKKKMGGPGYGNNNLQVIAQPMVKEAEIFAPYTYGLSSLKPAVEPVIMVQKPFEGSSIESIIKHGAGVVNVYETRHIDRWPSNFIAVHDIGCTYDEQTEEWDCVNGCAIGSELSIDPDFTKKYATFAYNELDMALASIDNIIVQSKPNKKERHSPRQNPHPTVKPIQLNQYFGKLFLPPKEYSPRRVFAPFSGSGSEIIGLALAGWDEIHGVEKEQEYAEYSIERIEHFLPKESNITLC